MLFFYAAHDRRDCSLWPHLISQKKRKTLKEKEVARQTKTQKINNIRTLTKNCYRSDRPFAGEVTSRPIIQTGTKKTFSLKRRARISKTKNYSITLALIVTGRSTSLETWTFLGDFLEPTVDDEIQAWNLTPL
jgi:hypothetical protein